jgi:putative transposase
MKQSTCSEEQLMDARRQVEAGTAVAEVCRTLVVSEPTCSRWQRQCAGLGIAELRRLRQLDEEHRKLTPRVAALTIDEHRL